MIGPAWTDPLASAISATVLQVAVVSLVVVGRESLMCTLDTDKWICLVTNAFFLSYSAVLSLHGFLFMGGYGSCAGSRLREQSPVEMRKPRCMMAVAVKPTITIGHPVCKVGQQYVCHMRVTYWITDVDILGIRVAKLYTGQLVMTIRQWLYHFCEHGFPPLIILSYCTTTFRSIIQTPSDSI
jgi:hypothetical protein